MTHRTRYTAALAAVGITAAVCAGSASAHPASAACNPIPGGTPILTADRYNGATVSSVVQGDAEFKVTWSDGYTRVVPFPTDCPTPTPPPSPGVINPIPPPADLPPTPQAPPTCAELSAIFPYAGPVRRASWGCPIPQRPDAPPPPLRVRKSVTTVKAVACYLTDTGRAYRLDRIKVTWTRGGKVVKVKTRTIRIEGVRCSTPVAG
jgi:hypothetical protein